MKRSRYIRILAASASLLVLAGCYEDETTIAAAADPVMQQSQNAAPAAHEDKVFVSMEECIADIPALASTADEAEKSAFDASRLQCIADWESAQAQHAETAPRFSSLAECQAEFGPEGCGTGAQSSSNGSGSFFLPLLAGYMIGNMMGGSSTPVYRGADNRYRTSPSASASSVNRLRSSTTAAQVRNVSPTPSRGVNLSKPARSTMTTSTRSRVGGFGKSGGGRGFGG